MSEWREKDKLLVKEKCESEKEIIKTLTTASFLLFPSSFCSTLSAPHHTASFQPLPARLPPSLPPPGPPPLSRLTKDSTTPANSLSLRGIKKAIARSLIPYSGYSRSQVCSGTGRAFNRIRIADESVSVTRGLRPNKLQSCLILRVCVDGD